MHHLFARQLLSQLPNISYHPVILTELVLSLTSTNFTITTPTQCVSFPPLLAEVFRNQGITVYLDMLKFATSSKIPVDTDKVVDIIAH